MKSLIVLALMVTLFAGCLSDGESPQLGSTEVFTRLAQERYVVVSLEAIELSGQEITANLDAGHGVATAFRDTVAGDGRSGSWFARVQGETYEPKDLVLLQILPNQIIELNKSLPFAPVTVYEPQGFGMTGINSTYAMELAPFDDNIDGGHYSYRWYGDIEGGPGFNFRLFPVWALKWDGESRSQSVNIDAEKSVVRSVDWNLQTTRLLDEQVDYSDTIGATSGEISLTLAVPINGTKLTVDFNGGFAITGENGYFGEYSLTDPQGDMVAPVHTGSNGESAYFEVDNPAPGNWTLLESHDVPRPAGTSFHVGATLWHF